MYVNSPVLLCSSYSTRPLAPLTDRNKPAVWAATPREAGWIWKMDSGSQLSRMLYRSYLVSGSQLSRLLSSDAGTLGWSDPVSHDCGSFVECGPTIMPHSPAKSIFRLHVISSVHTHTHAVAQCCTVAHTHTYQNINTSMQQKPHNSLYVTNYTPYLFPLLSLAVPCGIRVCNITSQPKDTSARWQFETIEQRRQSL